MGTRFFFVRRGALAAAAWLAGAALPVWAQAPERAPGSAAPLALERRVVVTAPDEAPDPSVAPANGRSLHVDLSKALGAFAPLRWTIASVLRNGVPSHVPADLSAGSPGELRWREILPGHHGSYRITVRAEDGAGRTQELVVPVEVQLPPNTPDICERPERPWCAFARRRWAQGEAAGNLGDFYNNRDGGHANFPIGTFSKQIRPLTSGKGAILAPLPGRSVVGNASVFYQGPYAASVGRFFSFTEAEFAAKVRLYESNHIFWYPAHTDIFGNGDLFHYNAAYSNVTVGSSGSELDEVERTFVVWASLRPDVKSRLRERGLLAPVTAMLLRRNRVASDAEYLTGAAHMTGMFDIPADQAEARLLELAQAANAITVERIPPFALLRVVHDDFWLIDRERLATNRWAAHRIWRRDEFRREVVLSAADSFDLNGRPLSFHWSVLRGAAHARIEPLDEQRRSVRVTLTWPARFQIDSIQPGGQGNWTNRIDIGLFAHNGEHWSAPAMYTVHALDSEVRLYDRQTGKLLNRSPSGRPVHPRLQ
jgi:hypothetical protein